MHIFFISFDTIILLVKKMIKKIDYLEIEKQLKLVDNVLKTSFFCKDNNFANELISIWADYFNKKTHFKLIDEVDGEINAMCFCIIGNSTSNIHYDIDRIKPQSKFQEEYINLRKRITNGYSEMHVECDAELEIMSCLTPNKGIGTNLLSLLEEELKKQCINKYIVCTNETCSYGFYESHGFKLLEERYIDISDLKNIFPNKDRFRIMCYQKEI